MFVQSLRTGSPEAEQEARAVDELKRARVSAKEWKVTIANLREKHHSRILCTSLGRVSLTSANVRWNCHASNRLDSAKAMVYVSMSIGSVSNGFAVRTYLSINGLALSDREMACKILDG